MNNIVKGNNIQVDSWIFWYVTIIVTIGALGRVYVYAHHVFDVIVGILLSYLIHIGVLLLFETYNYDWRIYSLITGSFMLFMITPFSKRHSAMNYFK